MPMHVLNKWKDMPSFTSEDEEVKYWRETALDPRLMNGSIWKADTRDSTTITLRFDPRMLARIKRLARSRYLNYQSMIKQWLSERLEKEL
jgi:predicted DNA binding CopG/RHH family protein